MPDPQTFDDSSPRTCDVPEPEKGVVAAPASPVETGRVEQVITWLVAGHSEHNVVEAVQHHWPDQNMRDLMLAVVGRLKKTGEWSGPAVRGWCFEAAKDLYRRMVEIGDFAGALRAVKQIYDMAQ